MPFPSVSIIIPAYNAQDTIGAALEALFHQTYSGRIEIIVIDDGSHDGTADRARIFPNVRYFRQENTGPAGARNHGARVASGEILLFTDADCRPEKDWIEKMVAGFDSEDIGVVAGSYGIANPGSLLARIIYAEIIFRHKKLMPEFPRAFGSYNVAIRRQVFKSSGGFDESYRNASGEDNDLSYKVLRQGQRIRFLKDARVDHFHQEDLARYLQEQYRHGFWRAKMYLEHPAMAGGDDYTFWKDILEVPLVFLQALFVFWPWLWLGLVVGFLLFEIISGFFIFETLLNGVLGGLVMWLRAFARVAGLSNGIVYFHIYSIFKKICQKIQK
jgi:GT2 family glycosyltransferase